MKDSDDRLPHIAQKLTKQIHKTALGAEQTQSWTQSSELSEVITHFRSRGYIIAGLEQTATSVKLSDFKPSEKIVLLLGREVEGIDPHLLKLLDVTLEIPMFGKKESFNVVQAAAMSLYHLRFTP
jgi:tRNA G18 (ribose-2'-O)-methylase SpoU